MDFDLDKRFGSLFSYEKKALLAALQRDLRAQQEKAAIPGPWATYHESNRRLIARILEVLNPELNGGSHD